MVFMCAGLPCFIIEDANKDNRIDLKDVILNSQYIDAEDQINSAAINICTSAMQVVAGMKHISAASGGTDDMTFLNLCFLISASDQTQILAPLGVISSLSTSYTSISSLPAVFPPIYS